MPAWYHNPHWLLALVFLILGFAGLLKGADLLVSGAVSLARRCGLGTAVIGATVVAFGTSLPELAVSLTSLIQSQVNQDLARADIALANVVGSNIFNIGLILGCSALWRSLPVARSSLRLDYPIMLIASCLLVLMSIPWQGEAARITAFQGSILCMGLIAFMYLALRLGKVAEDEVQELSTTSLRGAVLFFVIGIALLSLGGEVALTGAISLARQGGLSERVIGLTVVALGTSLPELITSIQATRRGHTELAVANVIGSNIFNVFCIVGIGSLLVPIPVHARILYWDYWWMLGMSLLLLPLILIRGEIRRLQGALLVFLLVLYMASLLLDLP